MRRTSGEVDLSGAEKRQVAVASATLGPWRPAAAVGTLGAGVSLVLHLVRGHFGLGVLSGALSVGGLLFFCVGGAGTVLGYSGRPAGGRDRRLRRWARTHPWQVAVVPAAAMFLFDVAVRQVLTGQGIFGTVWTALWHAVGVAVAVGVVGTIAANRGSR